MSRGCGCLRIGLSRHFRPSFSCPAACLPAHYPACPLVSGVKPPCPPPAVLLTCPPTAHLRLLCSALAGSRARAEDEQRRQKFTLVSQAFAKKEEGLLQRLEAAEAAAAQAAADAQQAQQEQQQLAGEVAAAQQRLAAAAAEAEAALAAAVAPLQKQLVAAQEAAQRHEQEAEESRAELEQLSEEAERLSASLQAARKEAASMAGQMEAAAGSRTAAEEQARALQEEVEALRECCQQLQEVAQQAQQAVALSSSGAGGDGAAAAAAPVATRASPAAPVGTANPGNDGGDMAAAAAEQGGSGGGAAFAAEREALRQAAADAEKKLAAGLAVQQAKVAALEKQNRELSWQVAMLTRGSGAPAGGGGRVGIGGPPGSVAVPMPAAQLEGSAERPVAVAVGWVLRHRRQLLGAYLVLLHLLVYICATLLSRCRHPAAVAAAGAG